MIFLYTTVHLSLLENVACAMPFKHCFLSEIHYFSPKKSLDTAMSAKMLANKVASGNCASINGIQNS